MKYIRSYYVILKATEISVYQTTAAAVNRFLDQKLLMPPYYWNVESIRMAGAMIKSVDKIFQWSYKYRVINKIQNTISGSVISWGGTVAHDVFISHSNHDKTIADALCASLESNGIRSWIAPRDPSPGGDWGAEIVQAIDASKIMDFIFSGKANESAHKKKSNL